MPLDDTTGIFNNVSGAKPTAAQLRLERDLLNRGEPAPLSVQEDVLRSNPAVKKAEDMFDMSSASPVKDSDISILEQMMVDKANHPATTPEQSKAHISVIKSKMEHYYQNAISNDSQIPITDKATKFMKALEDNTSGKIAFRKPMSQRMQEHKDANALPSVLSQRGIQSRLHN